MRKNHSVYIVLVLTIISAPIIGTTITQKMKKAESQIEIKSYALEEDLGPLEKEKPLKKDVSSDLLPIEKSVDEIRLETIQKINLFLTGKMTNKGEVIYIACKSQSPQVNAKLLTAIIILESGKDFNSHNVIHNNNVSGMNWSSNSKYPRNGWYVQYPDVDASIYDLAERLSKYYIAQGLTTIELIGQKYAPLDDPREGMYGMSNKHWVANVTRIYNQINNKGVN